MKRIRFTKKPPKIKKIVYDGKRRQTKYVRLDASISSKHEDTVIEKDCGDIFKQKPDINLELINEDQEEPAKNSYATKKKKLIEAWEGLREDLILTRLQELSPATHECGFCHDEQPDIIICQDCGPQAYYCSSCCERVHRNILFHKPQQWKGSMYVPIQLINELTRKDHKCDQTFFSNIYAVDMKGTQHICKIQLCRCETAAATLVRYNLWPATPSNPKIAFDIRFMELLSVLHLECHLPTKSFCDALGFLKSNFINLATDDEKNIYRAVVGDCLTEYNYHRSTLNTRHTITESSFTRECPICLKNPPIISMDANFGLVHKRSSGEGHGRQSSRHKDLFFRNHDNMKSFIDDYSVQKGTNYECSNFQAGDNIRSKIKNGKLDVTGVFGSVCKHDIPFHFMDLSHGERLSYPVYILKCLLETRTDNLVVMYDIACMLHKHLKKNNCEEMLEKCTFAIPVFHSFAHNMACQLSYGQRFVTGTGLTDGEGIERLWSYLRGFRKITKEMSLNNRQDLLTEAMLHHSEKTIYGLGTRMITRLKKCDTIIENTEKVVQDILTELEESEDAVSDWQTEWKSQCHTKGRKNVFLTVDEQYAESLDNLEEKK
ncbi:uncharacterized protein LOC143050754 [Mytilus galloprovincialis]|uniref:uncharacterized protein LOC143050754 n=1 Tax=Mytilus galloprovincialis TaxID=29158 RepID=UPI003F7CC8B7